MCDIGDYVVYVKNRDISTLGNNKKDIWKIDALHGDSVNLLSVSKYDKGFTTTLNNIMEIGELDRRGYFKKEFFVPAAYDYVVSTETKQYNTEYETMFSNTQTVGDTNMKTNNMVKRTTDANVSAAKVAATITAGKTLNTLVTQKVTPQLPLMVRGYADTVFGRVVMANIADFAVNQFMPNNAKAQMATEAMMQAAMLELADSFDLEGIVAEMVDSVALDIPVAE